MNLRNIPIQRKLTTIIMLTSGMVLVLTCFAFLAYEVFAFRSALVQEMGTMSQVIAENSTAAVAFNDEAASAEILSALRTVPSVNAAALYDSNGSVLAKYSSDGNHDFPPRAPLVVGHRFEKGGLVTVSAVERAGTRVGTFYLKSNLHAFYERLSLYGMIAGLVFAGSFVIAYILSRWLQQSIAQPILELARTANAVTVARDYSIRAQKFGEDELGTLTDSFNDMLGQIHARDAELLTSREKLKLALSASQTGTWEWNLHQERMIWDEFTEALFGLKRGGFSGRPEQMITFFHPIDQPAIAAALEATASKGAPFEAEGRIVWPDKSEHHLTLRGTFIGDSSGENAGQFSNRIHVSGVCLDITDRKRVEERIRRMNTELEERVLLRTAELTASNQEMEAFTYSVSHDLRAPLRHMIAFAEILQEEFGKELSGDALSYLQRIQRGARSMSQLVDDLLNLAKIGRQGLNLDVVHLQSLVEELIADMQPELKDRHVTWDTHDLPDIYADVGLMRQVLANLISNAVKYTRPKDEAFIRIAAERHGQDTILSVSDNGVGFNMKFADKLFGVFQRLHTSDAFEGTGVGLALVERIVRKHGGRVWAESQEGEGSTFYVALPNPKRFTPRRETSLVSGSIR